MNRGETRMPLRMGIVIPKVIQKEDLANVLEAVYSEYKGTIFAEPRVTVMAEKRKYLFKKDVEFLNMTLTNNDFAFMRKYGERILSVDIKGKNLPTLTISYNLHVGEGEEGAYPRIGFEADSVLYARTEAEAAEVRNWLDDVLGFAKLLMKHSGAAYLYGGYDAFGKIAESGNDVEFIHCRGNAYIRLLQGHVKVDFGLALKESEIERLVNETATVERSDGFTTVYLLRIAPKVTFGPRFNAFYQAVKELARNG